MKMGKRIHDLLVAKNHNVAWLAEQTGIDANRLRMAISRDSGKMNGEELIAKALKVSLYHLRTGKSDQRPTSELNEEERELVTLWRHIVPTERETVLRELRTKVEGYKAVAAHLASIGINIAAPDVHDFPFKKSSKT